MLCETVYLRPEDEKITLTTYISDNAPELKMPPRPAIIVTPGGGYRFLSDREGEPIVKAFLAAGFNAFLLHYSICEDAVFPRPLVDMSRAIVHVRENAEKYNIDPEKIFVVGFSAGGHLTASIGTLWHKEYAKAYENMPEGLNRPNGVILSYPVITSGPYAHRGSFNAILGTTTPTEEQNQAYSLELQVDEHAVPAYIWHTAADAAVPVQNSLMYAAQLAKYKIPFEMHIFPKGPHGLALANEQTNYGKPCEYPEAAQWIDEAIDWAKRL